MQDPEATEAPVDPGLTHRPLLDLLVQLIVIIASARIGGRAARQFGQPRAVGEIVSGIGIGAILTSGLIPLPGPLVGMASSPTLGLLAGLGLVLVVFQIGIEFDFSHLPDRHNRRATFLIATMGIIVPFASGLGLGLLSWEPLAREADRLAYALFVATAFAITALPVLGRILIELDLHRTRIGTIAIAAAAVTDVIGWLLLGTVTALTLARFSGPELGLRIALVGAFGAMAWWLLRPALYRILGRARLDERGLPGDLTRSSPAPCSSASGSRSARAIGPDGVRACAVIFSTEEPCPALIATCRCRVTVRHRASMSRGEREWWRGSDSDRLPPSVTRNRMQYPCIAYRCVLEPLPQFGRSRRGYLAQ